jgi:hypothetical protein
MTIIVV